MTLTDILQRLAVLWAGATARSLPRLGTIVANDGKFFERLAAGSRISVATWESFIRFFREPANWPEGTIPADAALLLDEIETIAVGAEPSVGKEDAASAAVADALQDTVTASRLVA